MNKNPSAIPALLGEDLLQLDNWYFKNEAGNFVLPKPGDIVYVGALESNFTAPFEECLVISSCGRYVFCAGKKQKLFWLGEDPHPDYWYWLQINKLPLDLTHPFPGLSN